MAPAPPPVTGDYLRPYAVSSRWNARPIDPVPGTLVIFQSTCFPTIASGAYSAGVFLAVSTDRAVTVVGSASTDTTAAAVADPDHGGSHAITIPRWPAGVLPAAGFDGHADIVDTVTHTIDAFRPASGTSGASTVKAELVPSP